MSIGLDHTRVAERVNSSISKGNRRTAVEAFCLIARHIMIVIEKQHVLQLFDVLHDTGKLSLIQHLKLLVSVEQMTIISKCDWSGARNWVEWWTRTKHLQMLSKPFAKMASSTWNKAPRNTMVWKELIHWLRMVIAKENPCTVQCNHCMRKIKFLHCNTLQLMGAQKQLTAQKHLKSTR